MKFHKFVCRTCKSEDVLCDAYAAWNTTTQEWEVENTFDKGAYCNVCDGETRLDMVELDPKDDDEAAALRSARARWLALTHGWEEGDEDTAVQYCETEGLPYDDFSVDVESAA